MALDKLTIINRALLATANDKINALADGSTEWQVGDSAFTRALEALISQYNWKFATTIVALVGAPSNPSPRFKFAFVRPAAAWLIRSVIWKPATSQGALLDYEIIGNVLCCDQQTDVKVEYVRAPTDAEVQPWFSEVLTVLVEGYILQGPNEDYDEANRRFSRAKNLFDEARSLEARQTPARPGFNSKMNAARRGRRGVRRPPAGTVFP